MEFYPILGAEISLSLLGGFRYGVLALYRLSGPQGYLIILLIILMWGTMNVRVYNKKPADVLQVKRQVYTELNGFTVVGWPCVLL